MRQNVDLQLKEMESSLQLKERSLWSMKGKMLLAKINMYIHKSVSYLKPGEGFLPTYKHLRCRCKWRRCTWRSGRVIPEPQAPLHRASDDSASTDHETWSIFNARFNGLFQKCCDTDHAQKAEEVTSNPMDKQ